MIKCVGWVIPALQKRFDELNELFEKDAKVQRDRSAADQYLNKLKEFLTTEQIDLLNRWEDQMTFALAREKESLYRLGLIDGIHVSAAIVNVDFIIYDNDMR